MGKNTVISDYEVMFAGRTGVTVLTARNAVFDAGVDVPPSFRLSPDNPRDLVIECASGKAVLTGLKKDYLDEALSRGFIMIYETVDDEVVRCTPCRYVG